MKDFIKFYWPLIIEFVVIFIVSAMFGSLMVRSGLWG